MSAPLPLKSIEPPNVGVTEWEKGVQHENNFRTY